MRAFHICLTVVKVINLLKFVIFVPVKIPLSSEIRNILPCNALLSFIVLPFAFRSLIYLEVIFVYDVS